MWSLVVVLSLVGAAFGDTTIVNRCNSGAPLPLHTNVAGCSTPPCGLAQLSTASIAMTIQSPSDIRSLQAEARAFLGFIPIWYDLGEKANACNSLTNSSCPVQEGEVLGYRLDFYIEPFFPVGISLNVEFNIVDEDRRQSVACIRLGIRVDPPLDNAVNTLISV